MISCAIAPDLRTVAVTFAVSDPTRAGERINVVGDFNDWDPHATELHRTVGGEHVATLPLRPGRRYRFRYLSEHGGWFNDESAGHYEYNEFGGKNCVLDLAILDLAALRPRPAAPGQL